MSAPTAPTSFALSRRFVLSASSPGAVLSWEQTGSVDSFLVQGLTSAGEVVTSVIVGKKTRKKTVYLRKKVGGVWKEIKSWRIQSRGGTDLSGWTTLDLSAWWTGSTFNLSGWRGTPTALDMTLWVSDTSLISYLQVEWQGGAGLAGISASLDGKAIALKDIAPDDEDASLYQIKDRSQAGQILVGQTVDVVVKELTTLLPTGWVPFTYRVPCVAQAYPDLLPATFENVLEDLPCSMQVPFTGSDGEFSATGLPPGLTINSTTGVVSGTPSTPGLYSFAVTYSVLIWERTATYSLRVVDTPELGSKTFYPIIGETFTGTPDTNGQSASTFAVVDGSTLPAGLTINATTGVISGVPSGSPGTLTTKIQAVLGSYGTKTALQTFVIKQYRPPVVSASAAASLVAGFPFSIPLHSTRESGDYYLLSNAAVQFELIGAPAWVHLAPGEDSQSAAIIGTAPLLPGSHTFTLRAKNMDGTGATFSIAASVSLPTAPAIENLTVTTTAGKTFTARLAAVAGGEWEWSGVPEGCVANENVLTGNLDSTGIFNIVASVRNAAGSDTATVTLQVLEDSVISLFPSEPEGGYVLRSNSWIQLMAVLPPGYEAESWFLSGQTNYYNESISRPDVRSAVIRVNFSALTGTIKMRFVAVLKGGTASVSREITVRVVGVPVILATGNWWTGSEWVTTNSYSVNKRQAFSIGLSASGEPTSWRLLGPAVAGVSISSDGLLSGKISVPGTYFFYAVAGNQYGESEGVVITIKVNELTGAWLLAETNAVMADHPEYTDIDVDVRDRSIASSSLVSKVEATTTKKVLSWKHHDDAILCLFFTDGSTPFTGIGSIRFGLRKAGAWDDDMLLELKLSPATAESGDLPHYLIPFNVSATELDDAMESSDVKTDGILNCSGEVEWTVDGKTYSSCVFPVQILRDVLR